MMLKYACRKVPRAGQRQKVQNIRPFLGWGIPILVTTVVMAIDLSPLTSYQLIKPNFAVESCWFHGKNLRRFLLKSVCRCFAKLDVYGRRLECSGLLLRSNRTSSDRKHGIVFHDMCVTLPHSEELEMPSSQQERVSVEKEHI